MAGLTLNPGERDIDKIVQVVRQLVEGRSNGIVTATLNPNAVATTVKAPNCSPSSGIFPCATTADAANDMATMSFTPGTGQFVITHANNARNDRTFTFLVMG